MELKHLSAVAAKVMFTSLCVELVVQVQKAFPVY